MTKITKVDLNGKNDKNGPNTLFFMVNVSLKWPEYIFCMVEMSKMTKMVILTKIDLLGQNIENGQNAFFCTFNRRLKWTKHNLSFL